MQQLIRFYEDKTQIIMQKYGPGPRVHYHTGVMDGPPGSTASARDLRVHIVASQERLLCYAAKAWRIADTPFHHVLDVGCGLGGGAIFWAQEFGAHVTAVTIAPSHIELVAKFAAQAGVGHLVQPLLCDALLVPGEMCFDAALAIDSSSSFDRRPWFRRLSNLVRPHGRVFIFDCFLGRPDYEEPFNHHWCAQIGSVDEYVWAAREAGFHVDMIEDVSDQAIYFWDTSITLMRVQAQANRTSALARVKYNESLETHSLVRQGLSNGGLSHRLMSFHKA